MDERSGIPRLISIGVTTALLMSLTYYVPALAKFRPWVEGDALPFAVWWSDKGADQETLPNFGGTSTNDNVVKDVEDNPGVSPELIAEANEATNPNSEEEDLLVAPKEPEKPINEASESLEPQPKEEPTVSIDPNEYDGITVEIENPKALSHFFESLKSTALATNSQITRISHWGDSIIGADGITSAVRRKLQARFGNAGKGWVNVAPGWKWYRPKDVIYKNGGWKSKTVTQGALKGDTYGYGGVAGIGYAGARVSYKAHAHRMELYYRSSPKSGDVTIAVDGGEKQTLSTRSETTQDAWHTVMANDQDGLHTFSIRASGNGKVMLYGVTLERKGPGVVYDQIGLIGTRASRILNYNAEHLKAQVAHRKPDLQIFMFGGNEIGDSEGMPKYKGKYNSAIQLLRAGRPNASCLIMTPVDHGKRKRGRVITVPRLKKMIPVQRELAKEHGCAFFDTWSAMGGDGAAGRWYRTKPRLAWGDYAHLTPAGDRVVGSLLYKALIKAFSDAIDARL